MKKFEKAINRDGGTVEFDVSNPAGSGGMKQVFFVKGRKQVVAFFHKAEADDLREQRLLQVIGPFNPTRYGQRNADYWGELFSWPSAMVDHPTRGIGILLPMYPKSFFFSEGARAGQEKNGSWFNNCDRKTGKSFRHVHVDPTERGTLRGYIEAMLTLAQSVQRMHNAGLAHSDLSENNVLVDPVAGRSLIIDVDSLVVTGMYPPDVLGTPGFIAPEVMGTKHLAMGDPRRAHASAETDKHALAVMMYRYLMERHPLEGKAVFPGKSAEEEDLLKFGSSALYCEHDTNVSNRPNDVNYLSATVLGTKVANLFRRAFVDGLTAPAKRPMPGDWVTALRSALDNLVLCENKGCTSGWFVHSESADSKCPYCRSIPARGVTQVRFEREGKPGWYRAAGEIVVNASAREGIGTEILRHHVYAGALRGPGEDPAPVAEFVELNAPQRGIYLHNIATPGMRVREGGSGAAFFHPVGIGRKLLLTDGLEIHFDSSSTSVRGWVTIR